MGQKDTREREKFKFPEQIGPKTGEQFAGCGEEGKPAEQLQYQSTGSGAVDDPLTLDVWGYQGSGPRSLGGNAAHRSGYGALARGGGKLGVLQEPLLRRLHTPVRIVSGVGIVGTGGHKDLLTRVTSGLGSKLILLFTNCRLDLKRPR
ncbi:hypothetical protein CSOJ01_05524 [Colletotrichum sojae]|uniref:Uncharacterized protein n=1 Tax=Colletotrichum sojae TaxID=2175907 RepID=A0A8H6JFN8_9PEZI|nr:hypothetical protein CSOJ01_05524 [Colletotrichum sojae]